MARFQAIAFDLLTGLLDSWTLWDRAAGGPVEGKAWRMAYLDITYRAGAYVPYEELVQEAARRAGTRGTAVQQLLDEWDSLEPWPGVAAALEALAPQLRLAIVTNCSDALAERAVARLGSIEFVTCVTAERVGAYKPDPRTYRRMLEETRTSAGETLFVAGSPFDIAGAAGVGMPVFWHNRIGLPAPVPASWPPEALIGESRTLQPIVDLVRD